ncbi:MAG TPA: RNA methyltransferase [Acidimicrobiales bacterium]|nr:RNA methyltransferase [Acidimicrobiales bacterium]
MPRGRDEGGDDRNPRERFLTVFGRIPVLEALADESVPVSQVFVAIDMTRSGAREIDAAAAARGISVHHVRRDKVTRISGTGRQHQGVAADILAPNQASLESWVQSLSPDLPVSCVLLDGVTTPANVGMIIRSAVAAGLQGIVVPTFGVAQLGPLVIKASAGVALRAPLLRIRTALEAAQQLRAAGFDLVALDAAGVVDLWHMEAERRTALVLGGEHGGISDEVKSLATRTVRVPLAPGVESLNVAAAAAVAFFELRRPSGPT